MDVCRGGGIILLNKTTNLFPKVEKYICKDILILYWLSSKLLHSLSLMPCKDWQMFHIQIEDSVPDYNNKFNILSK